MKPSFRISLLLASLVLAFTALNSCDWDTSPEPDHPLYVAYTISASTSDLIAPIDLKQDINLWIKANQLTYVKQVNYSTGDASEFTKTDNQAISEYEKFLPLFQSYLEEVKAKLAAGTYGKITTPIDVTFAVFAKRDQGEGGNLKYDQVKLVYP